MLRALLRTYIGLFREYPTMARLAVVGACVGIVYALVGFYALPLYLADDLHLSAVVIGWVSSTFLVVEMLLKFPLGRLSDRVGRRPLIAVGPAMSFITALLIPLVPAAWFALLFLLRAVDGIALAAVWPAAFALITETVPARSRAAAMSVLNAVYMAGLALGPALGGLLMLGIRDPWLRDRSPFFLASLAMLVGALVARFGLPAPTRTRVHAQPMADLPMLDGVAAGAFDENGTDEGQPGGCAEDHSRAGEGLAAVADPDPAAEAAGPDAGCQPVSLHNNKPLMGLVLFITAAQLVALTVLQPFLPLYAVQVMHLPKAEVPLLFVVPGLMVAALGLPMGHLSDRWGKARSVKLAMAVAAACMVALPLFSSLGAVMAVVTVLLIAYLLGTPAWLALIADLSPAGAYGGTLGAVATAQGIGASIGPIIGGHLWEIDYRYSFWASALLLFVCAALAIAFLPRTHKPRAAAR